MQKEPMEQLDRLYIGQSVKIYQNPFTEKDFEGEAEIKRIDEIYRDGSYYKVELTLQFPGDKSAVSRDKFYTT